MKNSVLLVMAVFLMVSSAPALMLIQKVTSDSTEQMGVTAQTKKSKDGTFTFTVTRYVNSASLPGADTEWKVEGLADLEVANRGGLLCKTRVAAETLNGRMVYTFSLSRDCIPFSHFTLFESTHHKDAPTAHSFFGTRYQFDLPEIADRALKAAAPLHP